MSGKYTACSKGSNLQALIKYSRNLAYTILTPFVSGKYTAGSKGRRIQNLRL